MVKRQNATEYSPDNILGWSEADFRDVICSMINVRISLNQPLTPSLTKYYHNESATWHREKLGLTEEYFKQEEIKELEKKLEALKKCT